MKKTIYVYDQESTIYQAGPHLAVRIHEKVLFTEPMSNIEAVVLFKLAQITTQCICALFKYGICIVYTTKYGSILGCSYPRFTERPLLKTAQYRLVSSLEASLGLAKEIITAKVSGQIKTLHAYRNPAVAKLKMLARNIMDAKDCAQLLGIEGSIASVYFSAFAECLARHSFIKRAARPAHDPVNAVLNLSYMLTLYKIDSILFAQGFDTTLGVYHTVNRDRMSLSLDLLEPFRGFLDRFVIKLFNRDEIKNDQFVTSSKGCVLNNKGFCRYIERYEEAVDIRDIVEEIASRLKKFCLEQGGGGGFDLKDLSDLL